MTRKEFLKLPLYFVLSLLLGRALGKLVYEWLRPKPKPVTGLKLGKGIYEQMKEGNVYQYKKLTLKDLEEAVAGFYKRNPTAPGNMSNTYRGTMWYNGKMYKI